MRKFRSLLFLLKQSHVCYCIICMAAPLKWNLLRLDKKWFRKFFQKLLMGKLVAK